MSGQINNTDLLAAANQSIKAINDLCSCLSLSVSVTTNVDVGVTLEMAPGTEGGTPPEGASEPSPIADRKCQVAEIIYNDVEVVLQNLVDNPLQVTWFDLVTFSLIIKKWVEEGTLLLKINTDIFSWLTGKLAVYLVSFDSVISYTSMLSVWQSVKTAVICHLYTAVNPTDARTLVGDELIAAGSTQTEADFITEILLTNNLLNVLWFTVGSSESVIDTFIPTFDCATSCIVCNDFDMLFGSYLGQSTYAPQTTGWLMFECASVTTGSSLPTAAIQIRFCEPVTILEPPLLKDGLILAQPAGVRYGSTDAPHNIGHPLNCNNADIYCRQAGDGMFNGRTYPDGGIKLMTFHRPTVSAGLGRIIMRLQEVQP